MSPFLYINQGKKPSLGDPPSPPESRGEIRDPLAPFPNLPQAEPNLLYGCSVVGLTLEQKAARRSGITRNFDVASPSLFRLPFNHLSFIDFGNIAED